MEQITCANAYVGISTVGHYEELEQPSRTMWVNLQSVNPAPNLPLLLGFKFPRRRAAVRQVWTYVSFLLKLFKLARACRFCRKST